MLVRAWEATGLMQAYDHDCQVEAVRLNLEEGLFNAEYLGEFTPPQHALFHSEVDSASVLEVMQACLEEYEAPWAVDVVSTGKVGKGHRQLGTGKSNDMAMEDVEPEIVMDL